MSGDSEALYPLDKKKRLNWPQNAFPKYLSAALEKAILVREQSVMESLFWSMALFADLGKR